MFVLDNNFKVVHTLRLRTAQTSIKKNTINVYNKK